jgi:hypothetical protein
MKRMVRDGLIFLRIRRRLRSGLSPDVPSPGEQ